MLPYTDKEQEWLSDKQPKTYKKSNTNKERKVEETEWDCRGGHWFVNPTRAWGIKTTVEVDGKQYVVPVQL